MRLKLTLWLMTSCGSVYPSQVLCHPYLLTHQHCVKTWDTQCTRRLPHRKCWGMMGKIEISPVLWRQILSPQIYDVGNDLSICNYMILISKHEISAKTMLLSYIYSLFIATWCTLSYIQSHVLVLGKNTFKVKENMLKQPVTHIGHLHSTCIIIICCSIYSTQSSNLILCNL